MRSTEASQPRVVGVARISGYLRNILSNDKWLRNIGVRGEISNVSSNKNGNVYFDLKDADALLNCVVWSDRAGELPKLANGQQAIAYGEITAYSKASRYQLIAYRVELEGVGRLHELFERLKRKLEAEGAFAPERKRPIPRYPFRIALVSSRGAAGATDFLKILRERAPHIEVIFEETPVQGIAAADEIVRAINRASRDGADCVVVARGGGSYEDLFAFNAEEVARAIMRCASPVISAVGHESDVSIADWVADKRAETPSAAAHLLAPVTRDELLRAIGARGERLERLVKGRVQLGTTNLQRIVGRSAVSDPARITGLRRQHVDRALEALGGTVRDVHRSYADRLRGVEKRLDRFDPRARLAEREKHVALVGASLDRALERGFERAGRRLGVARAHLDGKNPEAILQQGYAIVRYDGRSVRDAAAVPDGAIVSAKVARGTLVARVERKEEDAE